MSICVFGKLPVTTGQNSLLYISMCYVRKNRRILKKKKKYLARKNSSVAALDVNLKMRKLK